MVVTSLPNLVFHERENPGSVIAKIARSNVRLPNFAIKRIVTFIEAFLGMETWPRDIFEV